MTRADLPIVIAITLALAAGAVMGRDASPGTAASATPKPTATGTPPPTATPLPAGYVHVRVVNDVNGNGREDPGERGIAGAYVGEGCGDAYVPFVTDANGDSVGIPGHVSRAIDYDCYFLQPRFGWLPVSPFSIHVTTSPTPTSLVMFFVRDLGRTVMELRGETIVRGVPQKQAAFSRAAPPFSNSTNGCVESYVLGSFISTVIVVGSDQRPGCPSKGDRFSVMMEGATAGTFVFEPGTSGPDPLTFAVGGDSFRVDTQLADGAQIDGVDCAVVQDVSYVPSGPSKYIAVLSDEARPGCGTPGKFVRFTNGGRPLDPLVPWQAGRQPTFIEFTDAAPRVITPPNTGSAGLLPGPRAD